MVTKISATNKKITRKLDSQGLHQYSTTVENTQAEANTVKWPC